MAKAEEKNFDNIADIDWARLAAFIDGEGCIRIHHNSANRKTGHKYHGIQIVIAQRDDRLVEWLFQTFGGLYYKAKAVEGKTQMNYWRTNTILAVEILKRCLKYFVVKRDQAEVALEYRQFVTKGRSKLSAEVRLQQEELRLKLDRLKHGHKIPKPSLAAE